MSNIIPITKPSTFEDFWKECPKKEKRALTQSKWSAITSEQGLRTRTLDRDSGLYIELHLKATPEELIKAMKVYRDSQIDRTTWGLKDGGRFTLHPATWLNQGRWMDTP